MLRITKHHAPDSRAILALEGRLIGPWVAELRQAVTQAEGPTAVDLAGVTFADADGVAALRSLRNSGIDLIGASGFLTALMGAEDGADRIG